MEITLVPLSDSQQDIPRILSWALDQWGERLPNYSPQDWVNFYASAANANYQTWVGQGQELVYLAKSGELLVGTIALVDFDDLEEFRELKPWVAAFIVNPELRGRGFGNHILTLLEGRARSLGIERLYLWTEDQSNFYRKRKYEQLALSLHGDLQIFVMQKVLDSPL